MDIKAIKEKYDNNVPLKDIAKRHHITLNKLNSIIKTQGWHRKRRGGTKGNKGVEESKEIKAIKMLIHQKTTKMQLLRDIIQSLGIYFLKKNNQF